MLQSLRNNMKLILLIVLIAFLATIVFSWGMGGFKSRNKAQQGIVGVVAGQKIMYQQFQSAVQEKLEERKAQNTDEQDLTDYQKKMVRDQAWEEMVQNVLLAKEVKRLGIEVTPEEVVFQLRNNPPEYIRAAEQFQTDGQFDIQKYQQALSDPRNYQIWIPIENYLKSTLPVQKLYQQVVTSIRVSDAEVLDNYKLENETVNIRYLFFNPQINRSDSLAVSDNDIKAYYNAHKADYEVPEKRVIQYLLFKSQPSREDSSQTHSDMEDIIQLLKNGADFEDLAKEYSEDEGSKDKGGDLGFIGKNRMVKPFEDAAFNASIGEIVGPIETQDGLHVLKVVDKKKEDGKDLVHAYHILLKYKISPDTYDAIFENAKYFAEEATHFKGSALDTFAIKEGLDLKTSTPFEKGEFVPGLGMASRVNNLTFKNPKNWVSDPVYVENDVIVFRVHEIQKAHVKPLEEVKDEITSALKTDKMFDKAKVRCHEVAANIKSGQSFEEAAQSAGLQIMEPAAFSVKSYVPNVGRDAGFNGAAFKLEPNEISEPVKGQKGYYIIQLLSKNPINMDDFEAVKEQRAQQLLQQKRQKVYVAWFENLKENAKVKDYRNEFF